MAGHTIAPAAARALTAPLRGTDWGDLAAGTQVLEGEYYWLVYAARPKGPISARWYVKGEPCRLVTPPTAPTLLLCAGFAMAPAQLGPKPSLQQRNACARGVVDLSLEVHQRALDALRQRP